MLRKLIIWLMKTLLNLQIFVSLIGGGVLIVVTLVAAVADGKIGGGYSLPLSAMLIAEIALGAFALVALFGVISLLIEINENLIRLRQTPVRRVEPQI
jgi:hypothetical protein